MTDGLRIAHPQDCPLEGNPEVGNPEGNRRIESQVSMMIFLPIPRSGDSIADAVGTAEGLLLLLC